jgi:hypothetical protein
VRQGQCQLRDTVAACPRTANTPRPRRGGGETLEYLLRAYAGPRRDVGPAGSCIPVAVSPVRPSPPLPHHARHCGDIPALLGRAGTRRRHNGHCATYGLPVNGTLELAHHGGRSTNYRAATLEAAPVCAQDAPRRFNGSGIRQDGRQLRSAVRHTITRIEIVQRVCKLLPPWPIKGGAAPQPQGTDTGRRTAIAHTLSAFPTILALASIKPQGLGGHASSSASLVAASLRAPRCEQYSATSTPLLDVRPRPEPG